MSNRGFLIVNCSIFDRFSWCFIKLSFWYKKWGFGKLFVFGGGIWCNGVWEMGWWSWFWVVGSFLMEVLMLVMDFFVCIRSFVLFWFSFFLI